jgi:hypothetical protein
MAAIPGERLVPTAWLGTRTERVPEHSTSGRAVSRTRRRAWRFDLLVIVGSLAFTVGLFGLGALILRVA